MSVVNASTSPPLPSLPLLFRLPQACHAALGRGVTQACCPSSSSSLMRSSQALFPAASATGPPSTRRRSASSSTPAGAPFHTSALMRDPGSAALLGRAEEARRAWEQVGVDQHRI